MNLVNDWQLGTIALLNDHQSQAVSTFSVTRFPTTFLLDETHVVVRRWEGFVASYELSVAVDTVMKRS